MDTYTDINSADCQSTERNIKPANIPDIQELLPVLMGNAGNLPDWCDVEAYLSRLDVAFDMPEPDKRELVAILWQIMETFIGFEFGLDPIQTVLCERSFNENAAPTSGL